MKRTTVFIEENLLSQARRYAKRERTSFASLVREALASYLAERTAETDTAPAITGAFASGKRDTAERADKLLWTDPHS